MPAHSLHFIPVKEGRQCIVIHVANETMCHFVFVQVAADIRLIGNLAEYREFDFLTPDLF